MKKTLATTVLALLFVTGCSSTEEPNTSTKESNNSVEEKPGTGDTDKETNQTIEEGSYAAIVVINGQDYIGQNIVSNDEYTIKEHIGEVKTKVDHEKRPSENWSSNVFEEGTKIYSVNERNDVFLIEVRDNEYTVLAQDGAYSQEK
ncbi:hypothetical protein [Bacillus sp. FJAT-52991]|uniref:Lipoprotein n=1 Tax=Bacillus kandeliae TaxID=3129297 RepID=A0ABZ2NB82_9BACI